MLVVPHRVKVEAGGAPEQKPLPGMGERACVREQAPQLDEPRVDEQRAGPGQLDDRALKPERVADLQADVLEDVAPSR